MTNDTGYVSAGLLVYRTSVAGQKREYLLVHASGERYKNHPYAIPKGRPDPKDGNNLLSTAVRETFEETGVRVKIIAPLGKTHYEKEKATIHAWLAEFKRGIVDRNGNCLNVQWENDVARFFTAEEAYQLIRPELKVFLDKAEKFLNRS